MAQSWRLLCSNLIELGGYARRQSPWGDEGNFICAPYVTDSCARDIKVSALRASKTVAKRTPSAPSAPCVSPNTRYKFLTSSPGSREAHGYLETFGYSGIGSIAHTMSILWYVQY
eukprot:1711434-Prymnesium_polylepis.1